MPKKEIGELIIFFQSIIDDAKHNGSSQAMAFLDFEKAFVRMKIRILYYAAEFSYI